MKKNSIGTREKLAWVEESFSFDKATGRQIAASDNRAHIGSSLSNKVCRIFIFIIFSVLSILFARLIMLQIIRGDEYYAAAEINRQRIVPIPSERGIITDRKDMPLTQNMPNFSLALIPQHLPRDYEKRKELVRRLSEITGRPDSEITSLLEEYGTYSYESIVIQENIDYEKAILIQIAASDLPGIQIIRGSKRRYIHDPATSLSLSHIIGYEGKLNKEELDRLYGDGYFPSDLIGKYGIEKTYESYLRGTYGKKRIEVDALGREQSVLAEIAPIPGYKIRLSIDANMQSYMESLLQKALVINKKKRASGIALDPRTGEILALVSLPSFDNNDFSEGITKERYAEYGNNPEQPLFNRSIGGMFPSGSVIKPAIAAAALAEGVITPATVFLSAGGLRVGEWFFPDWKAGGHGWTNVVASLANSVNTFYYYIGGGYEKFSGLGVKRITDYLSKFGFGSELGIDISGEAAGFLPSESWKEKTKNENWYIGDTYNLSIGQGDLLVTPLQIAAMTSVIANGGALYRPHLVKEIVNAATNEKTAVTPTIINSRVVPKDNIDTVRAGMRACVTIGSCRQLANLPFAAAGKTGTAQWRKDKDTHGWFTSFGPFESPEIVVTILVEEGGEGSGIASPIAKDFYWWWWNYKKSGVDKNN